MQLRWKRQTSNPADGAFSLYFCNLSKSFIAFAHTHVPKNNIHCMADVIHGTMMVIWAFSLLFFVCSTLWSFSQNKATAIPSNVNYTCPTKEKLRNEHYHRLQITHFNSIIICTNWLSLAALSLAGKSELPLRWLCKFAVGLCECVKV